MAYSPTIHILIFIHILFFVLKNLTSLLKPSLQGVEETKFTRCRNYLLMIYTFVTGFTIHKSYRSKRKLNRNRNLSRQEKMVIKIQSF